MKKAGSWVVPPNLPCADMKETKAPDQLKLNLLDVFKTVGKDNILGEFKFEGPGKNYPQFKMNIERLVFNKEQAEPSTREEIGKWEAGFGEEELITFNENKDLKNHVALTVFRIVTVVVSYSCTNLPIFICCAHKIVFKKD